MSSLVELVVVKNKVLGDPDKGTLDIIFTRNNETGEISLPQSEDFPTLGIWISKNYSEIDHKYKDGELFSLKTYYPLDESENTEGSNTHQRHYHWSKGDYASPLDGDDFIPILNSELPEKSSGLLNVDSLPVGIFFIGNNSYIYGPFSATSTESGIIASPHPSMKLNLPTYHILKLNSDDLIENKVLLNSNAGNYFLNTKSFISSVKDISTELKNNSEKIDYINDTQLITYFSKTNFGEKKGLISRKEAESLKKEIFELDKNSKASSNNERIERIKNTLDRYLENENFGFNIIHDYLSNETGQIFLERLIDENPELIKGHLSELDKKKEDYEEEIKELELKKSSAYEELKRISNKVEGEKVLAQKQIDEIREKTKEEAKAERKKVSLELEEDIARKQSEKKEIEQNIEEYVKRLEKIKEYSDVVSERDYTERRLEELTGAVKAQELKLKNPELPKEVTELKTLLDLLQGRTYERKEAASIYVPPKMTINDDCSAEEFVGYMVSNFEDSGRGFSYEEMANLLICNQQSFLTVLKGLPGSGKTSTAIRLAQSHHLIESENSSSDNFLNIPVSRGWVSGRDFLGFYNSMKGVYQPAKTGMYQFLSQSREDGSHLSLRLILLDEANLSPIEHYWSDFLGMCDSEGRMRKIDTGMMASDRYLEATENIRFIATINNDSTTEPLSPRLLDRVPVVSMDYSYSSITRDVGVSKLNGAVGYMDLEKFFGKKELLNDESVAFSSFFEIMEKKASDLGTPIVVSKRKRIAMQSYYEQAINFMEPNQAVDFALSQHALPLINGYGKPFKERLIRLLEQANANNYIRTTEILDSIICDGDIHIGSYSFF